MLRRNTSAHDQPKLEPDRSDPQEAMSAPYPYVCAANTSLIEVRSLTGKELQADTLAKAG